jgi:hypothetical protein
MLRTSGPIVRVAPNEYSISEPGDLQTIYGHTSHFIKVSRNCWMAQTGIFADFFRHHGTMLLEILIRTKQTFSPSVAQKYTPRLVERSLRCTH